VLPRDPEAELAKLGAEIAELHELAALDGEFRASPAGPRAQHPGALR
jgi:hypothetical protein